MYSCWSWALLELDLVYYNVIIWVSPSGEMHCGYCARQNVVVPSLFRVKSPKFCGYLARTGCITNWLYNKTKIWSKLHGTLSKCPNSSSVGAATYRVTIYTILFDINILVEINLWSHATAVSSDFAKIYCFLLLSCNCMS